MKTEALVVQDWDDLVFENRNRDYGAYPLRKTYSTTVIQATFSGLMLISLAFSLPTILDWLRDEPVLLSAPPETRPITPLPRVPEIERIAGKPAAKIKSLDRYVAPRPVAEVLEKEATLIPDKAEFGTVSDTGESSATSDGDNSDAGTATEGLADTITPPVSDGPLNYAEVMPQFLGGTSAMIKFIQRHLRYPNSARTLGIEGIVFVQFVVAKNGEISDVTVIRGIFQDCDTEAARVIGLMPKWKPGIQNQSPVSVKMILPINFKLAQ